MFYVWTTQRTVFGSETFAPISYWAIATFVPQKRSECDRRTNFQLIKTQRHLVIMFADCSWPKSNWLAKSVGLPEFSISLDNGLNTPAPILHLKYSVAKWSGHLLQHLTANSLWKSRSQFAAKIICIIERMRRPWSTAATLFDQRFSARHRLRWAFFRLCPFRQKSGSHLIYRIYVCERVPVYVRRASDLFYASPLVLIYWLKVCKYIWIAALCHDQIAITFCDNDDNIYFGVNPGNPYKSCLPGKKTRQAHPWVMMASKWHVSSSIPFTVAMPLSAVFKTFHSNVWTIQQIFKCHN